MQQLEVTLGDLVHLGEEYVFNFADPGWQLLCCDRKITYLVRMKQELRLKF